MVFPSAKGVCPPLSDTAPDAESGHE